MPRSDIYGSRSDRVLASLWQTLLLNLVINGTNPRIDHWCGGEMYHTGLLQRTPGWAGQVVHLAGKLWPAEGHARPTVLPPQQPGSRRGHMGGLAGGALAALLVGPRWRQTTLPQRRGRWLVDAAPLPWLRSSPRPVDGGRGRLR